MTSPAILTLPEFCSLWRLSRRTVQGLCSRGLLPGAYRVGSRWRVDVAEFRAGAKVAAKAAVAGRRRVGAPSAAFFREFFDAHGGRRAS